MDTTALHDLFRQEFHDVVEPYLVSDAAIYTYINAAQEMFCRLTEGIADDTTYKLQLVAGSDRYPLNNRILKLRSARDGLTGRAVYIMNEEEAARKGFRYIEQPGPIRALIAGGSENFVRTWPTANAADTVQLAVFRLPKPVEAGDELEINPHHHMYLLHWVKHLAYGNQDADVADDRKAADFEQRFRMYCAKAMQEQSRARNQAGAVRYGGL